ncbi:MAG: hypothetical protein MZU97_11230 [Bacillus subtilis]|nr:hypothetical protein [Bacillus subtilis]
MDKPKLYRVDPRSLVGDAKIILNAACVVIPNDKNEILLQKRSRQPHVGSSGRTARTRRADRPRRDPRSQGGDRPRRQDHRLRRGLRQPVDDAGGRRTRRKSSVHSFVGEVVGGTLNINDDESLGFGWFAKDHLPKIHSVGQSGNHRWPILQGERNLVEGRSYR